MSCGKCGGETDGWKCADCGAVSKDHDPNHQCGGERCQPMCKGCGEAEEKCGC